MKNLLKFLSEFHPLPEKSLQSLFPLFQIKSYKKDDRITDFGEVPTHFFILTEGIIRSYIVDDKGKEFTRSLYTPMRVTGAYSALLQNRPSTLAYECLTGVKLITCDFKKFKELAKKDIELANLYVKILELLYLRMEKRIFELSIMDAKSRYLKLKKQIPNIENLIPQYHIASYLNVTPVQLSRIRKDLYKS